MDDRAACFVGPPPDEEEIASSPSQALQTPRVVQPLTRMEQLTADLNLATWSSSPPTLLSASTIRVSSDSAAFFVCLPPVDYCRPPPVADTPSPAANCPPRPVDLTSVSEAAVHELDKSATSAPERPQASTSWRNDAARCEATTHHFVGPSHAANRCDGGWRNDVAFTDRSPAAQVCIGATGSQRREPGVKRRAEQAGAEDPTKVARTKTPAVDGATAAPNGGAEEDPMIFSTVYQPMRRSEVGRMAGWLKSTPNRAAERDQNLQVFATSAPERPQASTSWRNDAARCEATTHHFVGPSHAANRCDGGWRNDVARREATSWRNDVADCAVVVQRDFVNCYRTVGPYHAHNRCDNASGAEYVRMATRMPVPLTPSDEDDEEEESDGMPDLEESDGMPDLVPSSESDSDDEDHWPPTPTPTLATRAGG